jgi:hypothetical protein
VRCSAWKLIAFRVAQASISPRLHPNTRRRESTAGPCPAALKVDARTGETNGAPPTQTVDRNTDTGTAISRHASPPGHGSKLSAEDTRPTPLPARHEGTVRREAVWQRRGGRMMPALGQSKPRPHGVEHAGATTHSPFGRNLPLVTRGWEPSFGLSLGLCFPSAPRPPPTCSTADGRSPLNGRHPSLMTAHRERLVATQEGWELSGDYTL